MSARRRVKVDCPHNGRHDHGTRTAYTEDGCGCDPCVRANSRATTLRRMAIDRGQHLTVEAAPVRAHLEAFRARDYTYPQISKATGVPVTTLRHIALGTLRKDGTRVLADRTSTEVAKKILGTPLPELPSPPGRGVDPTGAMRRIQSLMALGWSGNRIAEHAGVHHTTISNVLAGKPPTISVNERIVATFEELQHHRPVARNEQETKGITRALRRAALGGWPTPAAWDEGDLDNPQAPTPPAAPVEDESPNRRLREDDLDEWILLVTSGVDIHSASQRIGAHSLRTVRRSAQAKKRQDVLALINNRMGRAAA